MSVGSLLQELRRLAADNEAQPPPAQPPVSPTVPPAQQPPVAQQPPAAQPPSPPGSKDPLSLREHGIVIQPGGVAQGKALLRSKFAIAGGLVVIVCGAAIFLTMRAKKKKKKKQEAAREEEQQQRNRSPQQQNHGTSQQRMNGNLQPNSPRHVRFSPHVQERIIEDEDEQQPRSPPSPTPKITIDRSQVLE